MPRNPHKRRCEMPGCRAWAMRGHVHCRQHRDGALGPRGAGAPRGNLNGLRTGRDAHPFSPGELQALARAHIEAPHLLEEHLAPALASILARAPGTYRSLAALRAALRDLMGHVAGELFAVELEALLAGLPPDRRAGIEAVVWKEALPLPPEDRLFFLRAVGARLAVDPEEQAP